MKRFVWIVGVVFLGFSQAYAAPKNYGLVTIAYNDLTRLALTTKNLLIVQLLENKYISSGMQS